MDDEFKIFAGMVGLAVLVFSGLIILNFLTSSQTGQIAGYSISMPGIAWVGVPAFIVLVLILYAKNRM